MTRRLTYAEQLELAHRVTEPAIRQAIAHLELVPGGHGLDLGCGIGRHTLWLAEAAGPGGRVVGVDDNDENLAVARRLAGDSPIGERIELIEADLRSLPFPDASFDWIWCADTFWPGAVIGDPVATVSALRRTLKPGGRLTLLYWSSQSLLPGHPALEARLDAAFAVTTRYMADIPPERQFMRAGGWLQAAGLADVQARTFLAELAAPLAPPLREALAFVFAMLWDGLEPHLEPQDWDAYRRLCDERSPECVLDAAGYYGFVTYTAFSGRA